jgi:hypothetical protein
MKYPSVEEVKQLFDYHPDGFLIWKIKSSFKTYPGYVAGSPNASGYSQVSYKSKKYKTHRLIWIWHGYKLDDEIDHIDGNKLNNKIENLRAVKKNQNQWNSKIRIDNKSGVKGVLWHKRDCKWSVSLRVNKKARHFGYYKDLEFAQLVAEEARSLYHGEYARNK